MSVYPRQPAIQQKTRARGSSLAERIVSRVGEWPVFSSEAGFSVVNEPGFPLLRCPFSVLILMSDGKVCFAQMFIVYNVQCMGSL